MRTLGRMAHLADVYPQDGSGALRWPDGTLWVPLLMGSGLLGRITRRDRHRYIAAMESQLVALDRAVRHHRAELRSAPTPRPEPARTPGMSRPEPPCK